jgi:antitoxin HigA-1
MKKKGLKIGMKPSHPGAFIKTEVLDEFGLSVTKAAEVLHVRRATLSDLLNEKAALTPEMALRLEKAFNLNMDMLLRMQAWHDATEMRKQEGKIKIAPYAPAQM